MPNGPGTYGPWASNLTPEQMALAQQIDEERRRLAAVQGGDRSHLSQALQQRPDPGTPEGFEQERRGNLRGQMGHTGSVAPNMVYEPWMGEEAGYGSLTEARQPGARYNYGFGNVPESVREPRSVEEMLAGSQRNDMLRGLTPSQRRLLDAAPLGEAGVPGQVKSNLAQAMMDRDAVSRGLDPSSLPKREYSFQGERGLRDYKPVSESDPSQGLTGPGRTRAYTQDDGGVTLVGGSDWSAAHNDPELRADAAREGKQVLRRMQRVEDRIANKNKMENRLAERRAERAEERIAGANRASALKAAKDPMGGGNTATAQAYAAARGYLKNTGDMDGARALFNATLSEGMQSQKLAAAQKAAETQNQGFLQTNLLQHVFGPMLGSIATEGGEFAGADVIQDRLGGLGSMFGGMFGGGATPSGPSKKDVDKAKAAVEGLPPTVAEKVLVDEKFSEDVREKVLDEIKKGLTPRQKDEVEKEIKETQRTRAIPPKAFRPKPGVFTSGPTGKF